MTDIPEMYLFEAVRRFKENMPGHCWGYSDNEIQVLARTLQELGWTPPIDEARMAKARKVAAAVCVAVSEIGVSNALESGSENRIMYGRAALQAAYDALGED